MPDNRTTAFDRALDKGSVTDTRGADYGHPGENFARTAAMESILSDCPDPRLRHVLYMIATNMARLVHKPDHIDSWVDIAGYARTACMVLDSYEMEHVRDIAQKVNASGFGRGKPNFGPGIPDAADIKAAEDDVCVRCNGSGVDSDGLGVCSLCHGNSRST